MTSREALSVKLVLSVLLYTLKPVSTLEVSVQMRVSLSYPLVLTVRSVGALGG